jgi:hypothetical protein
MAAHICMFLREIALGADFSFEKRGVRSKFSVKGNIEMDEECDPSQPYCFYFEATRVASSIGTVTWAA